MLLAAVARTRYYHNPASGPGVGTIGVLVVIAMVVALIVVRIVLRRRR